jgi:hypothetical protein
VLAHRDGLAPSARVPIAVVEKWLATRNLPGCSVLAQPVDAPGSSDRRAAGARDRCRCVDAVDARMPPGRLPEARCPADKLNE